MREYNVGSTFERTAIDISGSFPESNFGIKYISIVKDYFTRWKHKPSLIIKKLRQLRTYLEKKKRKEIIIGFRVLLELHKIAPF